MSNTYSLLPVPKSRFFDANGVPLAGGQLFSYQAGTSTPLATYTDETGNTPNTNPVILDSTGSANVWMGPGAYKFVLEDSTGNVQWTVDEVVQPGAPVTISLTSQVTGVLPIANGGTNSGTALNNNRVMISSGGKVVEQSALTVSAPMRTDTNGLPTTGAINIGSSDVTGSLPGADVSGNISGNAANVTGTVLIANGGTSVTSVTTSATASSWAGWDANKNLSANNLIDGFATTATAGSSTALTVSSAGTQVFTGSANQTVTLPTSSTLVNGQSFIIQNQSTGTITVLTSGLSQLLTLSANQTAVITCVNTAGSGTAAFNYYISSQSTSSSGGGSGSKNYLSSYVASTSGGTANTGNGNFELGLTTGWSLGNVSALTNKFPSNTSPTFGSGSSGNLSLSVISSSQLGGSYSGSLVSSAATTAGDFLASSAFYIDTEDQAKVQTFKFYYQIASGASNGNFSGTSSNSFGVAIWDVTNSAWIQPTGCFGMTQSSGVGYCTGTFQTTSNSTQYRLVLYNANATGGAITVYVDDFVLGPQTAPFGPAMTDWTSFTPTGAWSTNTTYTGYWRRVGGDMELQVNLALGGAPTSATLTVNMPTGYTIDTTRLANSTANAGFIGMGRGKCAGTFGGFWVGYNSTTSVDVRYTSSGTTGAVGAVTQAAPATFASGDNIDLWFKAPITGWSSNVQMSSDTDTRVVAASYYTLSSTTATSGTGLVFNTKAFDTHAAYSAGTCTIPVTGEYVISGSYGTITSGSAQVQVFKNGSAINGGGLTSLLFYANSTVGGSGSITVPCNAGDTIALVPNGSFTWSSTAAVFSIFRLSGPSVIAATESVNARYAFVGSTTLPSGSAEALSSTYATYTKIKDTHGAFNTSTGVYTIGVSGTFRATLRCSVSPGTATTGVVQAAIVQAGSQSLTSANQTPFGAASSVTSATVSDDFNCLAGDTLTLQAVQSNGTSIALFSTASYNSFSIERVGN